MKKNLLRTVLAVAAWTMIGVSTQAQVTIGSGLEPQDGVLLELKTKAADVTLSSVTDDKNVTTDANGGGLLFPRVKLVDIKTLEPFITKAVCDANADHIKETHAGMVVYNLQVAAANETNQDKLFEQGLYTWDGAQWTKVLDGSDNGERSFYLPSCNIRLDETSFDIYAEYQIQFTRGQVDANGNDLFVRNTSSTLQHIPSRYAGRIYQPGELDYVVTYYDKRIMENLAISDDGLLTYTVKDLHLFDEDSFINIVLVVK
jgi:hypothetical protein